MSPLANQIADLIKQNGPMPLDLFMDLALAHPDHGYYRIRDPLGQAGDFTTAPEISQMFGELLGLWCVDMWQKLGSPTSFNLIEFGPGRGTLMTDALRASKVIPAFGDGAKITFLETSPTLKAEQKRRVPDAAWIRSVDALPDGPCLILANEFFDALPIKQFQMTALGWRERCVTVAASSADDTPAFQFCLSDATVDPNLLPANLREAPQGAISEICTLGQTIAEAIRKHLAANHGAALIVDYGYAQSAIGDTFQALKDHAYADPLEAPGEADLTAHVDFAALAKTFDRENVYGPVEQGTFLKSLGIEARAQALTAKATTEQRRDINAALKRLTAPDAMGSLFKVMVLTADGLPSPAGF